MAPSFGHSLRQHWDFAENYVPLNNGSFGAAPRVVRQQQREYQDALEARPDTFIRYQFPDLQRSARKQVASLLHVPTDTVVFVPNATTAFNVVVRSLTWSANEHILYSDVIYGGCIQTIKYLTESTPLKSLKLDVEYPLDDDALLAKYESVFRASRDGTGPKIKAAVFDTVTSMPGLLLPWARIVDLCRRSDVLSIVDGAHGVGHLPLDFSETEPDFFFSNLHKWLFVPRGCAVLFVPVRNQHLIRSSLPTSHGFVPLPDPSGNDTSVSPLPKSPDTPFVALFDFTGTIDNTNYATVDAALRFRREVCGGEEAIMEYVTGLARKGGKKVAEILGTSVMDNKSGTASQCGLATVRLPLVKGQDVSEEDAPLVAQYIPAVSDTKYYSFFPVLLYHDHWYVRLSAQVYLDESDFEFAGRALLEVCQHIKANGPR